ncbi:hypothetical protein EPI10_005848 [Gossypium australe]|uniref:Uncharacterized protein n=1 Tax=Gossypium australe TaxID=47621 RepID=A0A5B6WPH4_9ROSI|nr:hypothetical protein EPI10_005848 [Gossypium australe]
MHDILGMLSDFVVNDPETKPPQVPPSHVHDLIQHRSPISTPYVLVPSLGPRAPSKILRTLVTLLQVQMNLTPSNSPSNLACYKRLSSSRAFHSIVRQIPHHISETYLYFLSFLQFIHPSYRVFDDLYGISPDFLFKDP